MIIDEFAERHPMIAAFAAMVLLALITNRHMTDFIASIAGIAFIEMAILWAQIGRMKRQIEQLQEKAGAVD